MHAVRTGAGVIAVLGFALTAGTATAFADEASDIFDASATIAEIAPALSADNYHLD
jgi:hypothetical protein